jgi:hypothetical protein
MLSTGPVATARGSDVEWRALTATMYPVSNDCRSAGLVRQSELEYFH